MKRFTPVVLLSIVIAPIWAQSPPNAVVGAKESAAPQALTSTQKKDLQQYDFSGAVRKLSGSLPTASVTDSKSGAQAAQTPKIPPLQSKHTANVAAQPSALPAGWAPPHAELNPTALVATAVSSDWEAAFNLATPGADGRVVYMFGAGMPVLVCSPLRVCVLELQAGEHIQSQPQIGDSRRWEITPVVSGTGSDETPLLIVKPIEPGLDTDLVVPTDRRTYVVRLISDPTRYVSRVAFRYSADDRAKWNSFAAQQDAAKHDSELAAEQAAAAQKAKDKKDGVVEMAANAVDKLYFDYKLHGDPNLLPQRVMDDGQRTYICFADNNRFRELPTLMIVVNGKSELVNFRVDGAKYVVDRLFDSAVLIVGVGKKQAKVTISRKDHYVKG